MTREECILALHGEFGGFVVELECIFLFKKGIMLTRVSVLERIVIVVLSRLWYVQCDCVVCIRSTAALEVRKHFGAQRFQDDEI